MEIQADAPNRRAAGAVRRAQLTGLRRWNGAMGALHFAQGAAMLALASTFSLPVTSSFLRMSPRHRQARRRPGRARPERVGPLVAAFLFVSAVAHFTLASPWLHRWYERNVFARDQPGPLDRVLALLVADDGRDRDARRHLRHREPGPDLRAQRNDRASSAG